MQKQKHKANWLHLLLWVPIWAFGHAVKGRLPADHPMKVPPTLRQWNAHGKPLALLISFIFLLDVIVLVFLIVKFTGGSPCDR